MCCFPLEIQQICNVDKINESVDDQNVSLSEGNMKIMKISRRQQKRGTLGMLRITYVCLGKIGVDAQRRKGETPRMQRITDAFEGFENVNTIKE